MAARKRATDSEQPPTTRARARTPSQLVRQEKVYELLLSGKTVRQVAAEVGIDPKTVLSDRDAEHQRTQEERAAVREMDKEIQLAQIEEMRQRAIRHAGQAGTGALQAEAKALELKAKLLGLDSPIKVDLALDKLVDALNERPENPA